MSRTDVVSRTTAGARLRLMCQASHKLFEHKACSASKRAQALVEYDLTTGASGGVLFPPLVLCKIRAQVKQAGDGRAPLQASTLETGSPPWPAGLALHGLAAR